MVFTKQWWLGLGGNSDDKEGCLYILVVIINSFIIGFDME